MLKREAAQAVTGDALLNGDVDPFQQRLNPRNP